LKKLLVFILRSKSPEADHDPSVLQYYDIEKIRTQLLHVLNAHLHGYDYSTHLLNDDVFTRKYLFLKKCFKILGRKYENPSKPLAQYNEQWWEEGIMSIVSKRMPFTGHLPSETESLSQGTQFYTLRVGESFIQPQDAIVFVRGCTSPMMLRPNPQRPGTFTVVGEVYLLKFPEVSVHSYFRPRPKPGIVLGEDGTAWTIVLTSPLPDPPDSDIEIFGERVLEMT
jgi:hypothetical protein